MKLVQKAIIKDSDKYLILLRSKESTLFPLHWDFPGGKLEDEDPLDGIRREILEETSLNVISLNPIGVYDMVLNNTPHRFTLYSTQGWSGTVKISHEHSEYRWATKDEILKLTIEPFMAMYFENN